MARRKGSGAGRRCTTFFCDHRGGRFCCADCPDLCANRCLNSPDRCKLVDATPPGVETPGKNGHTYRSFDPAKALKLWQMGLTDTEIGERLGVKGETIGRWRRNEGIGPTRRRRNA